jgi:glyoxylase-like metal-dependent hydrolase (beta-lactamase superfamily II)
MQEPLRWQVGDVRITRVQELEAPDLRFVVPETTVENLAEIAWVGPFLARNGHALASVHTLVLEIGPRRIAVDTCIGNDKPRPIPDWNLRQGAFLEDLEKAGFAPSSIDTVICTHLHVDHVGWNTRLEGGRWLPTFPNARYLLGRREWEHWSAEDDENTRTILGDSVRPIFDAGLVDLVEADHAVDAAVRLEPTPGHTPGHVSVHITSRGEEAIITGDLVHHPSQFARPHWGAVVDSDAAQADRTRRAFMARYADTPVLVIGTHFAGPTAGHLVRDGDAYRLAV